MIVCCGVPLAPEVHNALQTNGVAVLTDPELCMRALGRIQRAATRDGEAPRDAESAALTCRAGPVLSVTIGQDREFGAVLALSASLPFGRRRRVVRALPVTTGDLQDAVLELEKLEGGLPAAADDIAAVVRGIVESHSSGTEARIHLMLEAGVLRRYDALD